MRPRLSPATALALIALIVSLGGTAFAAGVFTKKQKKQVTALATKVFDSKIGAASVKRAATAGSAETAAKATEALKAVEASRVTEAAKATQALRVPEAAKADFATSVAETARATQAATATEADRASTTGDANGLGNQAAGSYQREILEGCTLPSSIEAISPQGLPGCDSPTRSFGLDPRDGQRLTVALGNGLEMALFCGGTMRVDFVNASLDAANVNFGIVNNPPEEGFDPPPGITLDGARLNPNEVRSFTLPRTTFLANGQAVWVTPLGITTVVFGAIDRNAGSCELNGTAMVAFD
jgi:hypothetical protein